MNAIVLASNYSNSTGTTEIYSTPETRWCTNDKEEWKLVHHTIIAIGATILIFVGSIGNTVCFIVLNQKAFRHNLMSGVLRYLAILDNIILWTVVLSMFINGAFDFDITSVSYETCGLLPFYALVITSVNSWLLVVITATRLIHLMFPFQVHTICSKFNFYAAMVLIHVGAMVAHGGVQLTVYLQFPHDKPLTETCYYIIQQIEKKNPRLMITTVLTNFALPCSLLLVLTTVMVLGLHRLERRQQALFRSAKTVRRTLVGLDETTARSVDLTGNALTQVSFAKHDAENLTTTSCTVVSTKTKSEAASDAAGSSIDKPIVFSTPVDVIPTDKQIYSPIYKDDSSVEDGYVKLGSNTMGTGPTQPPNDTRNNRLHGLTWLLISACLIYLVLNIPLWIFHIFFAHRIDKHVQGCYLKDLILYIMFLFQYSNHSVNFYIYCTTGSLFRHEFFEWFQRTFNKDLRRLS